MKDTQGYRLNKIRIGKNLTNRWIAKRYHVPRHKLYEYENNQTPIPEDVFERLRACYGDKLIAWVKEAKE